jgi:hypothetical protein
MSLAIRLTRIAQSVSERIGAGFWPGVVHTSGGATYDTGGSIVAPGVTTERDCLVQVDFVTQAMRATEGYAEGDVRLLVLAGSLSGGLTADDRVEVTSGPHAGLYSVRSAVLDVAATHWDCRGRPEFTVPPEPLPYVPRLDFSDPRNSMYLAIPFGTPSAVPVGARLDFGVAANSQFIPLIS